MGLTICPLFSGSTGNAVLVSDGVTSILVDAGMSARSIRQEMAGIGADASRLDAIVVTHEHVDHVRGIPVLADTCDIPVYATAGTWQAMAGKMGRIGVANRRYLPGNQDFYIGGIDVQPFDISHDAAQPVGYQFYAGGVTVAVATDLGYISRALMRTLEGVDALVLEANHDIGMLEQGRYPYRLKQRILSHKGHLSNEDAGRALVRLVQTGTQVCMLGHLSKENNTPDLALKTVQAALAREGMEAGRDVLLCMTRRDGAIEPVHIQRPALARAQIGAGL
nr:MBL fold metallo-hydrolase [Maliibacterium massiliense]